MPMVYFGYWHVQAHAAIKDPRPRVRLAVEYRGEHTLATKFPDPINQQQNVREDTIKIRAFPRAESNFFYLMFFASFFLMLLHI